MSPNTIVFDCDGVLLNSNKVKSNAFYEAVSSYGSKYAMQLVEYNKQNGGISRFKKFDYFFSQILKKKVTEKDKKSVLQLFSNYTTEGMLNCTLTPKISSLKYYLNKIGWFIVSGGYEDELRDVFAQRNLSSYFNGIYGSPRNKYKIFEDLLMENKLRKPVLFLGDSKLDYEVSKSFGFDFIFISGWTEFSNWKSFTFENQILNVPFVKDITKYLTIES